MLNAVSLCMYFAPVRLTLCSVVSSPPSPSPTSSCLRPHHAAAAAAAAQLRMPSEDADGGKEGRRKEEGGRREHLEHVAPHADHVLVAEERLRARVDALHVRRVVPHAPHQPNVLGAERLVEVTASHTQ
eukprot:967071-Rhodomonas_salina.2